MMLSLAWIILSLFSGVSSQENIRVLRSDIRLGDDRVKKQPRFLELVH